MSREINYVRVTMKEPYGMKKELPSAREMLKEMESPQSVIDNWDSLNKLYRKNVRIAKVKRFFGKIAKVGAWYIGANIVIALGIIIATLMGVDVAGWYMETLGVEL